MSKVIQFDTIQPKRVTGRRRNVSWSLTYNRIHKYWEYEVTVVMAPQHICGASDTLADAQTHVDAIVRQCVA